MLILLASVREPAQPPLSSAKVWLDDAPAVVEQLREPIMIRWCVYSIA